MAEKISQTAIVRGMTANLFMDHFRDMKVHFGGKTGTPVNDSDFIGFYLETPDLAITHIGIVRIMLRQVDVSKIELLAVGISCGRGTPLSGRMTNAIARSDRRGTPKRRCFAIAPRASARNFSNVCWARRSRSKS